MKYQSSVLLISLLVTFFSSCQQEKAVLEERSAPIVDGDHPIERMRKIRKQLLDGADFQQLAKKHSDDPGSAQYGGNLGTVHFGQFVPEFEQAIRLLKPGEISNPVRTDFGYHIIQLVAIKGDQFTSRHILIRP